MSSQWNTLMMYPGLTPDKDFIGVCDGICNILLLEILEEETVVHPFEIQDSETVSQYQMVQANVKGKIRNALLCKSVLFVVVVREGISYFQPIRLDLPKGKIDPRLSDLEGEGIKLNENVFTCMVLSPLNTPLIIVFSLEKQFDVFEAQGGEGGYSNLKKVRYGQMLHMQLYVVPDGGGSALCDPQEENVIYLSTHLGADYLKGMTELQPDYEAEEYEEHEEPDNEVEQYEEPDNEAEQYEEEYEELDNEAEQYEEYEEFEENEEFEDDNQNGEQDEDGNQYVYGEQDEDGNQYAYDEEYFTIWTCVKECDSHTPTEGCPCQAAWLMLIP
ncbi:hypothetical protein HAX54_018856 [Datura stramonium]|uniref:Uncharacterized protein n=1 Tax=Datura stramonium TaxID=4076 RepID=A0ABS8RLJ5_DATST|nr:hypothetical protein [Datura stramonium]